MTICRGARFFAALAAVVCLTACSGADAGGASASDERWPQWDESGGVAEVVAFMNVAVPEGATEAKGAIQINPQEDIFLLSFVTDEEKAEDIAEDLVSEEPLRVRKGDSAEGERFGHLGLSEPQTLKEVRWAGVCPPCVNDGRRPKVQWIDIYVETLKAGRARVYLQAF
ncbi:hypothetical protein [Streptomyces sp. CAI-85]|uniref:hypothetical protein n=1 Tax=Streptomyces sp. CAI-85 TaxID=1472662 RepID=UPI0020CA370D|nr:hypothetical protein [Streptomyces sp. CAI-85]